MTFINGINLLPGTGEFTYDTVAHLGYRSESNSTAVPINIYNTKKSASEYNGEPTDFVKSIADLQIDYPGCGTVALIVAWFFNSTTADQCKIYPSTTYIDGSFYKWNGSVWEPDEWRVSGLTQSSDGLIPISAINGKFNYGGTPSDASIVNAIQFLKDRGKRVVFYPFLLGDIPGVFPWRGRIAHALNHSSPAEGAVAAFFGAAQIEDFTQNKTEKTIGYRHGGSTDWSYRRMILHYASLCAMIGGVNLFLIGSELRGLETIRGSSWTKTGQAFIDDAVSWDYPFVDGLIELADDVRAIFDNAGLQKDLIGKSNLVSYAADWSNWMGYQHQGEDGQWPHLDQLWGHSNIDIVCIDNYMPLSDWTTGNGGLDAAYWSSTKFTGNWPPSEEQFNGLGLTGKPSIYSKEYLKANIEGGEKFNWFYAGPDSNRGLGLDPAGSGIQVSRPEGNRLLQMRTGYIPGQELLANKQLRWWWNHQHTAIYNTGSGWIRQGKPTKWMPRSKPIAFTEYGFPSCDRATNQPNVFFDPKSSESFSPYWSRWVSVFGGNYVPMVDRNIAFLALQAIHEYWFIDGNNETSDTGLVMLDQGFCSVWAWDARPFPFFPRRFDIWGDAINWNSGHWIQGKKPYPAPEVTVLPPGLGSYPTLPELNSCDWAVLYKPRFSTMTCEHASGRESRAARNSTGILDIEFSYRGLRKKYPAELARLAGFFSARRGVNGLFLIRVPKELGFGSIIVARFVDDIVEFEQFMTWLWNGNQIKIEQVRGE
jgi:hypothetical protein